MENARRRFKNNRMYNPNGMQQGGPGQGQMMQTPHGMVMVMQQPTSPEVEADAKKLLDASNATVCGSVSCLMCSCCYGLCLLVRYPSCFPCTVRSVALTRGVLGGSRNPGCACAARWRRTRQRACVIWALRSVDCTALRPAC